MGSSCCYFLYFDWNNNHHGHWRNTCWRHIVRGYVVTHACACTFCTVHSFFSETYSVLLNVIFLIKIVNNFLISLHWWFCSSEGTKCWKKNVWWVVCGSGNYLFTVVNFLHTKLHIINQYLLIYWNLGREHESELLQEITRQWTWTETISRIDYNKVAEFTYKCLIIYWYLFIYFGSFTRVTRSNKMWSSMGPWG